MLELLNRDEPFVIEQLLELQSDESTECVPLSNEGSDEIQIEVQSGLSSIELEKTLQTFISVYNNLNLDECYHSQMLGISLLGIDNNRRNLQFSTGLRVSIAAGCSARVCPPYQLRRGLSSFFRLTRRRSLEEGYSPREKEERPHEEEPFISFFDDFHRNVTTRRNLQDVTSILEECLCRVRDDVFDTVPSRLAPDLDFFIDTLNEELARLNLPPILDIIEVDEGFQPSPSPPLKKRPKKYRYAKAAKARRGWHKGMGMGMGMGKGKGKGKILQVNKPYQPPKYKWSPPSPPRNVFFMRPR